MNNNEDTLEVRDDEKFCRECGGIVHETSTECSNCGASLKQDFPTYKNQTVAVLWAVFLGTFGAHYFYLGKWAHGIIFLLFCWTYIPTFISIITAIVWVYSSPEKMTKMFPDIHFDGPVNLLVKVLVTIPIILLFLSLVLVVLNPGP